VEYVASSCQVSAIRRAALAGVLVLASPLSGWANPGTPPPVTTDSGDPLKGVLHFLAPQASATPSHAHRVSSVAHAQPRSHGAPVRLARNDPPPPDIGSHADIAPARYVTAARVYARPVPRPYPYAPYRYPPYAHPGYGYPAAGYPGYSYRPYPYPYPYYAYRPYPVYPAYPVYPPYPVYRYAYRYPYPYGYPAY
jgi:hypothetical protein